MNLKYLCGWETYLKITDGANAGTVLVYFFSRSAGGATCNSALPTQLHLSLPGPNNWCKVEKINQRISLRHQEVQSIWIVNYINVAYKIKVYFYL